jgi:hypothetical protein
VGVIQRRELTGRPQRGMQDDDVLVAAEPQQQWSATLYWSPGEDPEATR